MVMILAIIITLICIILFALGMIFCIVPGIPGPPIAYSCLIIISLAGGWDVYDASTLIIMGFVTALTYVLDAVLPLITAKRAGASKWGIWGSIAGMLIGMVFFPPFGSVIGAFAGALAGELLFNRGGKTPLKSSFAILTGTLLAIVIKVSVTGIIGYFIIKGLIFLY